LHYRIGRDILADCRLAKTQRYATEQVAENVQLRVNIPANIYKRTLLELVGRGDSLSGCREKNRDYSKAQWETHNSGGRGGKQIPKPSR
jgi:hypothetical protein